MSFSHDDIIALLKEAASKDASEIHFKVPNRPLFRLGDTLLPTSAVALAPQSTQRIAQILLELAHTEVPLAKLMHEEFSFGVNSLGRFHVMLYRQRGSLAMVVRRISPTIPSLVELGIEACEDMLGQPGVILVAGGRKRRDAMAGLIDRFNASHRASVVTIEHPLTILHRDAMAAIAQREVGVDVESFAVGIHSAIRQQADLLAVSDVSDRATAEGIVSAAENGLQVIACVSAPSSKLARSWILRLFASETDTNIGERLERVLTGICCVPDSGSSTIDRM